MLLGLSWKAYLFLEMMIILSLLNMNFNTVVFFIIDVAFMALCASAFELLERTGTRGKKIPIIIKYSVCVCVCARARARMCVHAHVSACMCMF